MSDAVKWGILAAGLIAVVALIMALPFTGLIDGTALASAVSTLVSYCGTAFAFGRGLINNLVSPWARGALTVLLGYMITKPLVLNVIKLAVWALHFVYK